jgi:uncharacterized protein (TIGR00297 family)
VKWLTADGLAAAVVVGGGVAAGFEWSGLLLLLAFFLSGSLLTQWSGGPGGRRTARQVLANGGVAAAAALAGGWLAFAGAVAAATADTWATEIGAFSPIAPRLLTTGAPVPAGTSGGITALGTAGGVAGALAIATLAAALGPAPWLVVAGAGVAGMAADSLCGAALQGAFECASCGARHERADALCHEPVRLIRGWRWLDNDGVNVVATLVGAGVATVGVRLLS